MKRKIVAAAACVALVLQTSSALAGWQTVVVPGQLPIMIGNESDDWAVTVTCSNPDDVTISYLVKGNSAPAASGTLDVQADMDQHYGFDAETYQHNNDYVGFKTAWTDYSTLAVQSIGWAMDTVNIHIRYAGSKKTSVHTLSAAGADAAVNQLLAACGIQ